jgi:hypothetical protein
MVSAHAWDLVIDSLLSFDVNDGNSIKALSPCCLCVLTLFSQGFWILSEDRGDIHLSFGSGPGPC